MQLRTKLLPLRESFCYLLFWLFASGLLAAAGCGRTTVVTPSLPSTEAGASVEVESSVARQEPGNDLGKDKKGGEAIAGFRFPADLGGEMLGRLLPPVNAGLRFETTDSGPRRQPRSAILDESVVLLPRYEVAVPRLPVLSDRVPLRPNPLPEELPLENGLSQPGPPQARQLPEGERVHRPGPDQTQPLPLPILAHPVQDRPTLEDPAANLSAAAAQAASPPVRVTPAAPLRLKLPDSVENRKVVPLRDPPADDSLPVTGPPRLPGR
jgi:hypothetical protein